MGKAFAALALAGVVLALASCTQIVEDLPALPTQPSPVPVPVVGPTPVPSASPTPGPQPSPAPAPTPKPSPSATPVPIPGTGNNNPVTKLFIKVSMVECKGVLVPNSEFATETKVGCRIHFDATPKDAANMPTTPRGVPHWTYVPVSLVVANEVDPYAPILTAKNPGDLSVWAQVDGIKSQTLRIHIGR